MSDHFIDLQTANRRKQVLTVDDNPLNMKLFSALIESQGYEALEADNATQGLDLARRHHPALIVMDIQLPDISGYDAIRMLKAEQSTRDIPIIATTAFAHHADQEQIKQSKCDGFLAKPISISEFLTLINALIAPACFSDDGSARLADTAA
jgi:two-component system cell cycle response regulator DivK